MSPINAPASPSLAPDPVKRALDLAIAAPVLALLSPLWLAIGLAIRVSSPGPALHRGRAVGQGGREFTYYKFRSMRIGADDSHHRRFIENYVQADQPYRVERDPISGQERRIYKVVADPRVTPVGRILRRLSLDEVPQLINVVRGEMSLIGPRPPLPYEYALYDDWARQRLAVRPGISGLAQVRARNRASFKQMVELDLEYIRSRSLWLDLKLIVQTIPAMLHGQ